MFDRGNLDRALASLGVSDSGDLFLRLREAYTEPHRHYHTDRHVAECLTRFARLRHVARFPAEIEAAIWFHDAVYDPRRPDNEERSAAWAARFLSDAGVAAQSVDRVVQLVRATRTHEPHDRDAEILLDIDLGILGTPADVFDGYDAEIRLEYHFVPEAQFRRGRADILEGFLARPAIYRTPSFAAKLERPARDNLARKVMELRGS